ncbi:MAG: hypothetical protein NXI25_25605 [bacterium]|nr:hypothetical protein [bacterium]
MKASSTPKISAPGENVSRYNSFAEVLLPGKCNLLSKVELPERFKALLV